MNKRIETIEAKNLMILAQNVDYIFSILKSKSGRDIPADEEKTWKDAFAKNAILHINSFLEEMSNELEIDYKTDFRIDELKDFLEKSKKSIDL